MRSYQWMIKLPLHGLNRVGRGLRHPCELDQQEQHVDFVSLIVLRDPTAFLVQRLNLCLLLFTQNRTLLSAEKDVLLKLALMNKLFDHLRAFLLGYIVDVLNELENALEIEDL